MEISGYKVINKTGKKLQSLHFEEIQNNLTESSGKIESYIANRVTANTVFEIKKNTIQVHSVS